MKTKSQKRTEAIARNSKYRDIYLKEAEDKGLVGFDAKEYADRKQGIPKSKNAGGYTYE